jgi:glycosyltransferase involved in cell wall biosynthesis
LIEPTMGNKRVLMVAYHFPPLAGSSGVQRTLRFAQYLPRFGWEPLVLTTHPRAYEQTSDDLLEEIPPATVVHRAFALDTARHLSLFGRYPEFMARPDRWISWRFAAIRDGVRLIETHRPQVVWSTYPIATAHVIGSELARRTSTPWVADFRDPMAQDGYPADPRTWNAFRRIEEAAMRRATLCTFTAESAVSLYRKRYPAAAARLELLENGYDEAAFAAAEATADAHEPLNAGLLTLLHSGIVYPDERDPAPLFAAVAELVRTAPQTRQRLRLRFRAPVHDDLLRQLVAAHGLDDIVEILPAVSYQEALAEMLRADGLLVLQAANCNEQIPAKLYEYLRAQRPILAFVSPAGDTAGLLQRAGIKTIASLDDPAAIAGVLRSFVDDPLRGTVADGQAVAGASRLEVSRRLATLLDELVASAACAPASQ